MLAKVRQSVREAAEPVTLQWWQRVAIWVVLLGFLVLAVYALVTVGDTRASWVNHLTGVAAAVLLGAGACGSAVAPKSTLVVWLFIGWMLPVLLVWMGIEHWIDWTAYYRGGSGKTAITSEPDARVEGALIIFVALSFTFVVVKALFPRRPR